MWIAIASLLITWAITVGFPVPDYHSGRLHIVASLYIWRSGVAEWDYSRRAAAVDVSSTERIAAAGPAYYHGLARSVNGDDSRAVAAEVLFRLSLHAKFSHSVAFIQYYGHRSRTPPWPEICTRIVGQKPSQGEQLLFLLHQSTRSFGECRCLPTSRRFNQLAYPSPRGRITHRDRSGRDRWDYRRCDEVHSWCSGAFRRGTRLSCEIVSSSLYLIGCLGSWLCWQNSPPRRALLVPYFRSGLVFVLFPNALFAASVFRLSPRTIAQTLHRLIFVITTHCFGTLFFLMGKTSE